MQALLNQTTDKTASYFVVKKSHPIQWLSIQEYTKSTYGTSSSRIWRKDKQVKEGKSGSYVVLFFSCATNNTKSMHQKINFQLLST